MGDARTKPDVTYINDIRKSTADKRAYRGLILPNQLQVLLISDIETDKSAASLGTFVGSMNDPDDLPGLAHFCEHILDMGSEKYPGENEYDKFVSDHGGSRNAFTCDDLTVYYFDVDCKQFKNALDRFAQFFICPLITQSSLEREVNAVNSEYERRIPNDFCRLGQLEQSNSKSGHPYSRFSTGNKMTLSSLPQKKGIDVRKELLNFYEKWYSANIMTLIVLGKESLEDLEKMVVPIFSEIPNRNVRRPEWLDHPYGRTQVRTRTDVVPVKDLKFLRVSFPVPDLTKYYKAKPYRYITHLINHECPGSLQSVLKAKNWINSYVTASYYIPAKGFGFFEINADLTSYGVNHVNEIMTLLFQYLNMLRKTGPQKWIFEECQKLNETRFRFQSKEDPRSFVEDLQYSCRIYPLEEMISSPYLMEDWRPDLIEKLLSDQLNPSNVTVTIVAQDFESTCHEIEPWYGTKYKREKIPENVIREWENSGTNDEFKLPNPNEFAPSNFDILFKGEKGSGPRHPSIIHETSFLRVWFKQDDEFLLPKANLKFEFLSPLVSFDPFNYGLTYLFIELLIDSLNECTYYANLADLFYYIYTTGDGFVLGVSGFNEKQNVLLSIILQKMVDFKVDPRRFDVLKENYIRYLKNFKVDNPFSQSSAYLNYLLIEKAWTTEQILQACIKMKKTHLDEFIPRLLSKLYVECLLHGNIDRESAKSLIEIMERILIPKISQPVLPEELLIYRNVKLNNGEYLVKEITNKAHKSSCIQVLYQCAKVSIENKMLTQLLIQLIEEPCFNILRTKEQLGYSVGCYLWSIYSFVGVSIFVESDKHPNFVDQRIEAFLVHMREAIKNMGEEEFKRNKESLATFKSEKPKRLSELSGKLWNEITCRLYNFDRAEIEVAYLKTINKNDVLKYFDTYIQYGGPKRKKLSVHVTSEAEGGIGKLPQTDLNFSSLSIENRAEPNKIEDDIKFKTSRSLYPLPDPYVDIKTFKEEENKKNES